MFKTEVNSWCKTACGGLDALIGLGLILPNFGYLQFFAYD